MKTKVTSVKDSRWTRQGKMTYQEFLSGIKQAEEGRFQTIQESMSNFDQWLITRERQ